MLRAILLMLGLGAAVLAGADAVSGIGQEPAVVWAVLLSYVFLLSWGSLALLERLMRSSLTWGVKAFLPALLCSAPMWLGWFPVSSWRSNLGAQVGYQNVPSVFWLLFMLLFGMVAASLMRPRPAPAKSLPA